VDSQHPAYVLDVCYFGITAGFLYTVSRKYEDAQGPLAAPPGAIV
jgi:hypothetical protein